MAVDDEARGFVHGLLHVADGVCEVDVRIRFAGSLRGRGRGGREGGRGEGAHLRRKGWRRWLHADGGGSGEKGK